MIFRSTLLALSLLSAVPASADDISKMSCDITSTADLSDSCTLEARWERRVTIGLHYGTLASEALVIEVVRAPVTPAKLLRLNYALNVELQISTPDFSHATRRLE